MDMKKALKFLPLALAACLLATPALASSKTVQATLNYCDIKIQVDGQEITPTDVNGASTEPFAIDGTTYLPIRAISEALGYEVLWDEETGTVKISTDSISADAAIQGISTIAYVDVDGAKVSAIAVEYKMDLTGAKVDPSLFEVVDYGMQQGDEMCALGSDPGKPLKAYVNNVPAISETGGTGTGRYVIIEVNTDYQLRSVVGGAAAYNISTAASVRQVGTIQTDLCTIRPGTKDVTNYTATEVSQYGQTTVRNYANEGQYIIQGIDVFELHTKEDGTAFHATHCFDEETGQYTDLDLPYALYVPEDYDPAQKYMLVLHVHDASAMGDNPIITLTESQGPINYASDEVQQIAKDQGYGGLIVLAPQFNGSIRTTRDNWSLSAGVPATWQLLDYITETYNIDTDRIYASGQSMGGMQIMAMAAQRDNYFAALWPIASQWGTNYNLDTEYQGAPYYEAPADGTYIWSVDADGNPCNYRNMYYMLSDDNILVMNCADDMLSSNAWREYYLLYKDLTGTEILRSTWNPLTNDVDVQTDYVRELTAQKYELGIYWAIHEGGSHGDSWVYAHRIYGCYEWLLTQSRSTEMSRDKLALNRPFALADTQLKTDERLLLAVTDTNPEARYYTTGKLGAGTEGYNSTNYGRGGQTLESLPGWTPENKDSYNLGIYIFSFDEMK
jgi:predicted peptidase